ncbi:hypothetical protein A3D70_01785 [Candidatus Adlerbacteria bacterium RIFCSPHIGHO2_02_FULL_54_18]|uniref:Uncharacterized protein n=2 Tax=Candidatus Adleribacteriota TaxID=1752736 RepID=A0A1F4Y3V7_9BACT|nr:MAG: hypothetical protein A2949_01055 [Candidatus Adlerbacteria bacterium RIFCSPLOWO2_01_FULL_54_21b]OGC88538.1 MAG: hypothetical protein A3D70_01785 [Candidatus Adlerbacteria bacterium RIFCSPHIGHO2_02_FULL_54_18]
MKNTLLIGGAVIALLVVGVWWSQGMQASDSDVISRNGIHWHPTLAIYTKGVQQEIPANIGVGLQYEGMPTYDSGMRMSAIHTHDDMPVVHLEFSGTVRENDLKLGNFFRIWGKDMSSFGSNMRMMVNGVPNTEFEQYIMRDGNIIELRYD